MNIENEVLIPAYNIIASTFGFRSVEEKISTKIVEVRCDPDNTKIFF